MAKAGKLTIDLDANTSRLNSDFKKATAIVNKYKRNARKSFGKISKAVMSTRVAVIGLAGAAGFGFLIKKSLESADALAKTADKLGITTEKLAGLRHAADLSGVAQGTFDKSLQNMVRTIRDANSGLKVSADAYKNLGLDIKELIKLSPDEQFSLIADSINKVENNTVKLGAAYDIFGGKGTALINTLKMGSKGLNEASEEAGKLGLAISRIDAAKIEAANDAMTRVSGVIKGAAQSVAIELSPFLEAAAKHFKNMALESGGFGTVATNAIASVANALGVVMDIASALKIVWKVISIAVQGFVTLAVVGLAKVSVAIWELESLIPGIDFSEAIKSTTGASDEAVASLKDAKNELHKMMMAKPPSVGIIETFNEIKLAAEQSAIDVAESKLLENKNKALITQEGMNAEQLALITAQSLKTLTEQAAAEDRIKLAKKEAAAKRNIMGGMFAQLSTLMGSKSKRLFEIGKKAAIAGALIKGYESILNSYAAGSKIGGPVVGAAFAAVAGVATAVQIQGIRSQSFSGGGGVSTGGSPGVPSAQIPQASDFTPQDVGSVGDEPQRTRTLVIKGAGAHTEAMRQLLIDLVETGEDMGTVDTLVFA